MSTYPIYNSICQYLCPILSIYQICKKIVFFTCNPKISPANHLTFDPLEVSEGALERMETQSTRCSSISEEIEKFPVGSHVMYSHLVQPTKKLGGWGGQFAVKILVGDSRFWRVNREGFYLLKSATQEKKSFFLVESTVQRDCPLFLGAKLYALQRDLLWPVFFWGGDLYLQAPKYMAPSGLAKLNTGSGSRHKRFSHTVCKWSIGAKWEGSLVEQNSKKNHPRNKWILVVRDLGPHLWGHNNDQPLFEVFWGTYLGTFSK